MISFTEYLQSAKAEVEERLHQLLVPPVPSFQLLYESMNYSLLLGGKRIRPILIMMVLESLGKQPKEFMNSICAIEYVHSYSLIHDDLPAMDDDDYRRGEKTNHKVFGEGQAILAGDGLLTEAFTLMAEDTSLSDTQKVGIIKALSVAAGPRGMVGGQSYDLLSEEKSLSLEEMKLLHSKKTGALFIGAIEIGLLMAQASPIVAESLMAYGTHLGVLFQITDDILDVTGTLESLGKPPGSDEENHKSTYVSLLGLKGAQEEARNTASQAIDALSPLNEKECNTQYFKELIEYLVHRKK